MAGAKAVVWRYRAETTLLKPTACKVNFKDHVSPFIKLEFCSSKTEVLQNGRIQNGILGNGMLPLRQDDKKTVGSVLGTFWLSVSEITSCYVVRMFRLPTEGPIWQGTETCWPPHGWAWKQILQSPLSPQGTVALTNHLTAPPWETLGQRHQLSCT